MSDFQNSYWLNLHLLAISVLFTFFHNQSIAILSILYYKLPVTTITK